MQSLSAEIQTEADAYRHLERLRWGDTPRCSHCDGTDNVYLIVPMNGVSRKATNGTMTQRRVWRCRDCNKQFSVLTGTVMQGTKVPIRTWILVIFDMMSDKNGIVARAVERKYGVCPRTAWHMLCRNRHAIGHDDKLVQSMRGTIVSDETWVGGEPKWRHADKRVGSKQGKTDKTPVLALVNAVTGEVRTTVVGDVTGATLAKAINAQVDVANSHLWTDESKSYGQLGQQFASHETVNHSDGQYVNRKGAGTNMAEGFFSQMKRSVDGTHHHVSHKHLHRYCGEFAWRYTNCKASDGGWMRILASGLEGSLTYKALVRG